MGKPYKTMQTIPKTEWTIPAVLVSAFAKTDTTKLLLACKAHRNSAKGKLKSEAQATDVKLTGKGAEFTFNEKGEVIAFTGNADIVSRFMAQADSLKTHYKKFGNPVEPLTLGVFNQEIRVWLDDKFSLFPAQPAKGNGKRNGGIKSVKAPPVPA